MADAVEVKTETTRTLFMPLYFSETDKNTSIGGMLHTVLRKMGDKTLTEWNEMGRPNAEVDITITMKEV